MNGNMYEETLDETWKLFGAHLSGARSSLFCVLSTCALEEKARTALNSTAASLGYGRKAGTFAQIENDGKALDAHALFLLMEGLDPGCMIATDENAAAALGTAYRTDVPLEAPCRLLGRDAVAFRSFSAMLADDHDKQTAWALLKRLPRSQRH